MRKVFKVLSDQQGQAFLENALYIIIVVLLLAGAGFALANSGIKPKYDSLEKSIENVTIPNIGN